MLNKAKVTKMVWVPVEDERIVSIEGKLSDFKIEINSNRPHDKNTSLEVAKRDYEADNDRRVFFIKTSDLYNPERYMFSGMTVEQAREIAKGLNAMCDYIEGKGVL